MTSFFKIVHMNIFMPEMASTTQHNFGLWWRVSQIESTSETALKITRLQGKK